MAKKTTVRATTLALLMAFGAACAPAGQGQTVHVQMLPTCNCCKGWVQHLENNGFNVTTEFVDFLGDIKRKHNITAPIAACHTAVVEGYVVEGHVPAKDVARLLEERPDIAGISAPGMPIGSPGMEPMRGQRPVRFRVLAFDKNGQTTAVFATH